MLLLCGIPEDFNIEGSPYVYEGACIVSKAVECAGFSYHQHCKKVLGLTNKAVDSDKEKENGFDDLDEDARLRAAWEERNKNKLVAVEEDENLYEILDIAHLGFSASEKQIKKAYQKAILKHHPDKLDADEREKAEKAKLNRDEEDPMFLKVQRAWEILSDMDKRRGYDSQFAFDESIPSADVSEEDFYQEYEDVFSRNARFSLKKPVPSLGDDSTDINKVWRFYNFWTRFESWREFSKFDEFKDGDIENAQSRMERRWMIRQNEIIRAKRKKKEYERLKTLVARAMKCDPRLRRAREEDEAEKKRRYEERIAKKHAEEEAKRAKIEEERRKKEEEERMKKEEQDKARQLKQATKKAFKKQIRVLRKCCESSCELIKCEESERSSLLDCIQEISAWRSCEDEVLPLVSVFEPNEGGQVTNIGNAKKGIEKLKEYSKALKLEKEKEKLKEDKLREERMKADVEKRRKQEEKSRSPPWSPDELSFLSKATKKFPGGSRNRWLMVSNYVNGMPGQVHQRTPNECIEQSKNLTANADQRRSLGTSEAAFKQFQKKHGASAGTPAGEAADSWSNEQQAALEQALKTFPSSMDKNERWKSIAKAVEGKTKKECIQRFKFLRAKVLEKRGAAS